ncbi:hypothetical protein WN55_00292 [Dufourea novaeangliae]|uniref:Uncharacterized protein n=1 Tax=Dufourea novaeangliae TaxID=178035 RepID=A0A154PAR6_DUFNO|nr:hypothetical protein WN55_00292 [Dufourea novaeangliae]
MVISNHSIPIVEKFHYLKMSVTDEARQLIDHFAVANDSFDRALKVMTDRYENQRALIDKTA